MKTRISVVVGGAVCIALGVSIYFVTKRKQEIAKRTKGHVPYSSYEAVLKRPMDVVLSGIGLIILSPVLLITAILVRVKLGTPVIFKQQRPGKDEKIFEIMKFRTMTNEVDKNRKLLPDEKRLTSFGKKLRSSSLDELPELINVFKGDMSMVGPRPQLVKDMVFMSEEYRKRHTVLPGLTGLAQVSGRNGITWEEKLDKDLEYIKKITLFNDIKILLKTVIKVLSKDGINEEGQVTALDYGEWLLSKNVIDYDEYLIRETEVKRLLGEENESIRMEIL